MSNTNLASEKNAKLINQRFKEIEKDLRDKNKEIETLQNHIAILNEKLDNQTKMIQNLWVKDMGRGSTA